jgi:hypothetical protein
MSLFPQMDPTRHEYRIKGSKRVLYLLLSGITLTCRFLFAAVASFHSALAVGLVVALPFMVFGLCLLIWTLRSRVVIDGTRIEVRGAFLERTAALSDIEGFRTINFRYGSNPQLCLRDGRRAIRLSRVFEADDSYRAWMKRLTDLDALSRDALLDKIEHREDLGATPEERLHALAKAKTWSLWATIVAGAAAVALSVGPTILELPSAVLLALVHVAVLIRMRPSPQLYAVFKRRDDPRAELGIALLMPFVGLFFPAISRELVATRPLLLFVVPIALLCIAVFFNTVRGRSNVAGAIGPACHVVALQLRAGCHGGHRVGSIKGVKLRCGGYEQGVVHRKIHHVLPQPGCLGNIRGAKPDHREEERLSRHPGRRQDLSWRLCGPAARTLVSARNLPSPVRSRSEAIESGDERSQIKAPYRRQPNSCVADDRDITLFKRYSSK